jgi:spermidine synthase
MEKRARRMRFLLVGSTLVMGACGLIYEYVLSVLGNHLIGSSYEEIFIVIGIMMFAMGVGAGFQRYVKRELFEKFLLLEILLGLIGGFSAILIYTAYIHTESYRVILYGFSLVIGILIGTEIPLIIRINEKYALDLRANLSEILSMDYVGALGGAVLFTYVLLANFSLARIGFLLGLVNVGVACAGFLLFAGLVRHRILLGGIALAAAGGLLLGFIRAEDWTRYGEQRYFRDPIVETLTTKYQHLVLTKRKDRVNLYINGHLQFSSRDEKIYHEMLIHPAMILASPRKRILILGGGDGLALREVLKYPEVEHVTLVDIDREMVRLAVEQEDLVRLNQGAFHDSRVHVLESGAVGPGERIEVLQEDLRPSKMFEGRLHAVAEVHVMIMDAERFVRETEGLFDAVFIDLPDPGELELAKLYSVEFYAALRERLAPRAIVSVQSTSPYYARRVFLCVGETLRAAGFGILRLHDNVPSFGEWGWTLAWKSKAPAPSVAERLKSAVEFDAPTEYLTPGLLRAGLAFPEEWLEPGEDVEVNTLMKPVIIDYYREAWKGV